MQFSSESLGGSDFSLYPCPRLSELDEEQLFGLPLDGSLKTEGYVNSIRFKDTLQSLRKTKNMVFFFAVCLKVRNFAAQCVV